MTHHHPNYHKNKLAKMIPSKAKQPRRVRWELFMFFVLSIALGFVRLWFKVAFPEVYFDIAEKSTLFIEILSFAGIGQG